MGWRRSLAVATAAAAHACYAQAPSVHVRWGESVDTWRTGAAPFAGRAAPGVLTGYNEAPARVAKKAHAEDIPLHEAAVKLRVISGEEFNRHVDPYKMLEPT